MKHDKTKNLLRIVPREREVNAPAGWVSAEAANLIYWDRFDRGYSRRKSGRGFCYTDSRGRVIKNAATLKRLRGLGIPPAWTSVWICPHAAGHIQATGRDAKGRKQYIYHPRWREVRDQSKFEHMIAFAEALPKIRAAVDTDLDGKGLTHRRVVAAVVRLLEKSLIRVGNEVYAKENKSFGLTTMRSRHVAVSGSRIFFEFKGKSGIMHQVTVEAKRSARLIRKLNELPGQKLFQYLDDQGKRREISSGDVNRYLTDVSGFEVSAKDFRTWSASALMIRMLKNKPIPPSKRQLKIFINTMLDEVAARLGNTRTVCRKSYVHPLCTEYFAAGMLDDVLAASLPPKVTAFARKLSAEERDLLKILLASRSGVSVETKKVANA